MARRQEETENHWPGFVDVLSTIVMVVTFLLIILGIVIFVISKNVSSKLAESAQKVEAAQKAMTRAQMEARRAKSMIEVSARQMAMTQREAQRETKADKKQQGTAGAEKSASVFKAQLSQELTQHEKVEGRDKHAIRTRQSDSTRKIVIATTQKETDRRKVRVTSSTAVLSLLFQRGVHINDGVVAEIQNYLKSNSAIEKNGKYEIRAYFNTARGSISEARRLAYYRALATRNQLLSFGVAATNLSIKVSISDRQEDSGKVNIYLK